MGIGNVQNDLFGIQGIVTQHTCKYKTYGTLGCINSNMNKN
jgi:hypothetical protein